MEIKMSMTKKHPDERYVYFRYCKDCGIKYKPSGRCAKYCNPCRLKRIKNGILFRAKTNQKVIKWDLRKMNAFKNIHLN